MKCVALLAPSGSSGPLLVMIPIGCAFDAGVAAHRGRTIIGAELVEIGIVDDPRDHLAHVDRPLVIHRHDAQQFLGIMARRSDATLRCGSAGPISDWP